LGKSQRTKGASFEREVCDIFTASLGQKFKRNIGQARDGGNDIDVAHLVVECKRRKTLGTVESWLAQADAAVKTREDSHAARGEVVEQYVPLVVGRSDGGEPLAILYLEDFLTLTGDEIAKRLK
jgi:hypothetical protein